jgi:hypothetical protein
MNVEQLLEIVEEKLKASKVPYSIKEIADSLIVVLGNSNDLYYIQKGNIVFYHKCVT